MGAHPSTDTNFQRWDLTWLGALIAVIGYLVFRRFVQASGPLESIHVGPLELSVFGLLAAADLLFGVYLVFRWCDRFDLDWETLARGLPWIVLIGYYISHLVSVALYFPADLTDWRVLLDPRTRISSFGGMLGGGIAAIAFLRWKGLPVLRYLDALTLGFVGGYIFGRAGCFAIHDHPGRVSDFILAVPVDGLRRHDLGFYEMLLMLALLALILFTARKGRPCDGAVFGMAAAIYAPVRFGFDSLRVVDARYLGWTPGQWFAIPLLLLAVACWWLGRRIEARPGP